MPSPNIQVLSLDISLRNFCGNLIWGKRLLVLLCVWTVSLQAQDLPVDTVVHKHKVTEVYCKITTSHGHLDNETFHIYLKDRMVYEFTITEHITEYYFPISIEGWSPLEELHAYLHDDHTHYYHFKKRKRQDGVYEYDLVIDLAKIKRRENRHKKHGH